MTGVSITTLHALSDAAFDVLQREPYATVRAKLEQEFDIVLAEAADVPSPERLRAWADALYDTDLLVSVDGTKRQASYILRIVADALEATDRGGEG